MLYAWPAGDLVNDLYLEDEEEMWIFLPSSLNYYFLDQDAQFEVWEKLVSTADTLWLHDGINMIGRCCGIDHIIGRGRA